MEIKAEKIVFGGNSFGNIEGKKVFFPYAIPGETVDVKVLKNFRDYDVAEIQKIMIPSEHRVNPPCEYYYKCGGCNMLHIDGEYQKKLRMQILSDLFSQQNIKIDDILQLVEGPSFHYRCRFQLNDGGLSEKSSNKVVPVEKCLCAENKINEYLEKTPFESRPLGRIHLFGSDFSEEKSTKVSFENKSSVQNQFSKKNGKKQKTKADRYFSGTVSSPENSMSVVLNGKKLNFDVRGFFQSNLFVFEKVLDIICENIKNGECKNVLDMYSGCGSISAFLSDFCEKVVLVEHNRDAIVFAEENLMGKNHVSFGLSGASWVKNCASSCGKFDACVIDPPRSGMEKEVCDYLCSEGIKKIVSLSCDPATHARDCRKLLNSGYVLKKMYLLDFYPNTSHIESLAVFEK